MIHPNPDTREAIARIQFTRDGKALNEFLDESIGDGMLAMAKCDDAARTRLLQGEVRALLFLKDLMNPVSHQ